MANRTSDFLTNRTSDNRVDLVLNISVNLKGVVINYGANFCLLKVSVSCLVLTAAPPVVRVGNVFLVFFSQDKDNHGDLCYSSHSSSCCTYFSFLLRRLGKFSDLNLNAESLTANVLFL